MILPAAENPATDGPEPGSPPVPEPLPPEDTPAAVLLPETPGAGTGLHTAPAGAVVLAVGAGFQALVDAAPENAVFWIEAGEHRMQSVTPKDGQSFIGEDGAILNGSRLLDSFHADGGDWYADGQTQQGVRNALDEVSPNFDRAGYPDAVFLDDAPLKAVDTRAEVSRGTYYFDYAADRIYIGDDPTGHEVEAAVSPYAFGGTASGAGVTIKNLIVEKYAAPVQEAAIGGGGGHMENWTVQDSEVRLNFGVGIDLGSGSRIVDNNVHDNGEMGLSGGGQNLLVQGNEVASNGFWAGIDPLWEGGGAKFTETDGLIVRNNYSHDNNAYGFWTDIDNINTLYEGNRIENNAAGGISHEISYDAVIRNNTFAGNGAQYANWLWGGAIQIQNSGHVEVYGNTVDMTSGGNGITLIQQDRGSGAYGAYAVVDNSVHDNVVISRTPDSGGIGAVADYDEAGMLAGGNSFDSNEYHFTSPADDRFFWGAPYDWDGFRTQAGQDTSSDFILA